MASTIQRIENGAIALAILLAMIAFGQPWWLLLAAFLVFDLSALGYLRNARVGAFTYNAVHNFAGPAVLVTVYLGVLFGGTQLTWLVIIAACWAFHVAVDRALGYGLKLEAFRHTHLGWIGHRGIDRGRHSAAMASPDSPAHEALNQRNNR
ncbi:DUF4260 domain-containing protein [Microbacterium sp. UBA3394]|uniref:DUF4260 domain-containing protein n=1 Tax=Microbacterium sp. UBA3394 TaxID=1946945 RepID=UPI00257D2B35|nr:DUF4260 domain-containing protein [Microbacterium sp. UBA3394]|tara:strand:- start:20635 stop:21087 length:453 start_codon:yes stop_codon:yes gene_type:complete